MSNKKKIRKNFPRHIRLLCLRFGIFSSIYIPFDFHDVRLHYLLIGWKNMMRFCLLSIEIDIVKWNFFMFLMDNDVFISIEAAKLM